MTVLQIEGHQFRTLATDGDVHWEAKISMSGWSLTSRSKSWIRMASIPAAIPRTPPRALARHPKNPNQRYRNAPRRMRSAFTPVSALRIEVSRSEFEEVTADLLERTEITSSLVLRSG